MKVFTLYPFDKIYRMLSLPLRESWREGNINKIIFPLRCSTAHLLKREGMSIIHLIIIAIPKLSFSRLLQFFQFHIKDKWPKWQN